MLFVLFTILSILFIDQYPHINTSGLYSTSLQKKSYTYANQERIDYLDNQGEITTAIDLGYSTLIIIKDDISILEEYFDPEGNPVNCLSGYSAVFIKLDENQTIIERTYLGIDGKPIMNSSGYAKEEYILNSKNQKETIHFFDILGNPVCSLFDGYGKRYEYNNDGRIWKITYLDEMDKPMMIDRGYASVEHTFYCTDDDNNGKIENEFYFDSQGKPVQLSLGQFGIHKCYYDNGESEKTTYLDMAGNPIVTTRGYSSVLRISRNNEIVEWYYDLEGNLFQSSEGNYGIVKKDGNTAYLNKNGNEQFNIRVFLKNKPIWIIIFALVSIALSLVINKQLNIILLIMWICVIGYFTLMYRESGSQKINFIPLSAYKNLFLSAETRSGIIKNIWLFIPLGTILYRLCPQKWILLVPIVLSISIEGIQYFKMLGYCELDDVISNGLGGAIGYGIGCQIKMICDLILQKRKKRFLSTTS